MTEKRVHAVWMLALALLFGFAVEALLAQAPGTRLVMQEEEQTQSWEARTDLELRGEPTAVPLLPWLWTNPEPTAERIARGEAVCIRDVLEAAMWRRRFVWVLVESRESANSVSGWIPLGTQQGALGRLYDQLQPTSDSSRCSSEQASADNPEQ